ncbi:uncharacterized protein B0I36DRAFT_372275 [Microdochium trichocladiopsis]|uniref:FeS cluster biogenesis domain-containing protein n=1 Tax=Microdochium trichocladiopsis TaxID=1682393 RepID=A0A9P8YFQ1_9PEZI|nr:uncharacterized protein B0I36DRAFT_372275 [Microdochium trichocladiopsis]KAH7038077.1 hypothetical protein B0I36DRAFT_372275 [Microdochium trichocladiopsis]
MASAKCSTPIISAAKLFIQLSTRRSCSTTSVLDILAPAQTRALHLAVPQHSPRLLPKRNSTTPACPSPAHSGRRAVGSSAPQIASTSERAFSTTRRLYATQAIVNPQEDDDGKDMLLEITPRAAKRLQQIMTKDGNPNLALRIQVESGGCHGFQYIMSLTTLPAHSAPEEVTPSTTTSNSPTPSVLGEDDTVFAYIPDAAQEDSAGAPDLPSPTAKVILDKPSLDLLKGSKVDYTMELIGSQFKIVDNPYATSSCGCGTSFDIKM